MLSEIIDWIASFGGDDGESSEDGTTMNRFQQEHAGYTCETKHIKVRVNGSPEKRAAFNYIAGRRDPDWPWAPQVIRKDRVGGDSPATRCGKCGGYVYRQALLNPDEIRRLANQVAGCKDIPGALKVKVKGFHRASDCGAPSETLRLGTGSTQGATGEYVAGSC